MVEYGDARHAVKILILLVKIMEMSFLWTNGTTEGTYLKHYNLFNENNLILSLKIIVRGIYLELGSGDLRICSIPSLSDPQSYDRNKFYTIWG